jgi:ElaB/YqjD/DUF883 family membrane-anchored ribosome-binding protein
MSSADKTDPKAAAEETAAVASDVNALVAQAVEAIHRVVEDLSRLAADPSAKVAALKDAGKATAENLGEFAHDASKLGRSGLDEVSAAVRRNPLTWLAVAAGVGLIVGLWQRRDTSR